MLFPDLGNLVLEVGHYLAFVGNFEVEVCYLTFHVSVDVVD